MVKKGDSFKVGEDIWDVTSVRARLVRRRKGLVMGARGYRESKIVAFALLTDDKTALEGKWTPA
jgi:hypothetical protein